MIYFFCRRLVYAASYCEIFWLKSSCYWWCLIGLKQSQEAIFKLFLLLPNTSCVFPWRLLKIDCFVRFCKIVSQTLWRSNFRYFSCNDVMYYALNVMKCVEFCWDKTNKGTHTKNHLLDLKRPVLHIVDYNLHPVCPPFYSSSQQSKYILRPVLCTNQVGPPSVHLLWP